MKIYDLVEKWRAQAARHYDAAEDETLLDCAQELEDLLKKISLAWKDSDEALEMVFLPQIAAMISDYISDFIKDLGAPD